MGGKAITGGRWCCSKVRNYSGDDDDDDDDEKVGVMAGRPGR